jgi:hypothetical protein
MPIQHASVAGKAATTLTLEQIDAIQDPQERVEAINQHLSELFTALVWPASDADDADAAQ